MLSVTTPEMKVETNSQHFLKSQSLLLKSLLRDKGGAGCKASVLRAWLEAQEQAVDWLETEFKALTQAYEALLLKPRPFNLKRIKAGRSAPTLQWRVPNEQGSQVVMALFETEAGHEILNRLPWALTMALYEIEQWRVMLNFLSQLRHQTQTGARHCLRQLEQLKEKFR